MSTATDLHRKYLKYLYCVLYLHGNDLVTAEGFNFLMVEVSHRCWGNARE